MRGIPGLSLPVLALAAGLAGCGYVPIPTAARLAALDPLQADPGQIELAVVMPGGMDPLPNSARLIVEAMGGGQPGKTEFALVERPLSAGVPVPDGAHAHAYRLSEADVARMRAMQAAAAAGPAGGGRGATLSAALGGCRRGAGPAADAEGGIYVRVVADGPFLPLLGPARLTDMLGAAALAAMPPCSGAR